MLSLQTLLVQTPGGPVTSAEVSFRIHSILAVARYLLRFIIDCSRDRGAAEECSEIGKLPVLVTDPEDKCRHYENGDCHPIFNTSEYTSIVSEVSLQRIITLFL